MKHVTILVPKADINLSSLTGTYEILTRANTQWQLVGNQSKMEVCIAGLVSELKVEVGTFRSIPSASGISKRPI